MSQYPRLFWEKSVEAPFPYDTNLYAELSPGFVRIIGWVRQIHEPQHAGFYAHVASRLSWLFHQDVLDKKFKHPTRAQAMRALRHAALIVWVGTHPERRESFLNAKGYI